MTRDQAGCIQEIKVEQVGATVTKTTIKLVDKLAALKALGQHVDVKAFIQRVEAEVKVSLADRLSAAYERVEVIDAEVVDG